MSRLDPAHLRHAFAAAAAATFLATPALAADPWVLPQSGSGQAAVTESLAPSMLDVYLARSDHGLGNEPGWSGHLYASVSIVTGHGEGNFEFLRGADRLAGSLTSSLSRYGNETIAWIYYHVEQGEGSFAGWSGSGTGTVHLPWPVPLGTMAYTESGSFTLTPPAPVPEPATWALALAGGAMLLARRGRSGA